MRKDRLSSYQAKKEKLQKIKKLLINLRNELIDNNNDFEIDRLQTEYTEKIWEIVRHE